MKTDLVPADPIQVSVQKKLEIEYDVPDDLDGEYVNEFVISNVGSTIHIMAFAAAPPEFKKVADFGKAKKIKAKCKARLIVPPDAFLALGKAMQDHMARMVNGRMP